MAVRGDAIGDMLVRTTNKPTNNSFTMMGWFIGFDFATTRGHLLTYEADAGAPKRLRVETDSSLNMYGGAGSVGGSTLSTSVWFHATMTYNGTTALAYLNAVQDISIANGTAPQGAIYVGNDDEIGDDQWLNGRWAAIKLWSAVLNAAEIANEMRQYLPIRTANLNTFSPCLAASGAGIDYSGNGFNWSIGGTLTTEDGPPIPWSTNRVPHIYTPSAAAPSIRTLTLLGVGL